MRIRLLQAHRAADDLFGHTWDKGVGHIVEKTRVQMRQVVDAEKVLPSARVETVGPGQLARPPKVVLVIP